MNCLARASFVKCVWLAIEHPADSYGERICSRVYSSLFCYHSMASVEIFNCLQTDGADEETVVNFVCLSKCFCM